MAKKRSTLGRWIALGLVALALVSLLAYTGRVLTKQKALTDIPDYEPWSEEAVKIAGSIPVQDGGRVKPLASLSNFTLLGMHGTRKMSFKSGDETFRLSPTEWMLDLLFRPDFAMLQPTFRVDNSKVVEAIGIKANEKRDRYSYKVIDDHREKLIELATGIETKVNAKEDLTVFEKQVYALGRSYREYQGYLFYFTFIRQGIELPSEDGSGVQTFRTSDLLKTADAFIKQLRQYENPQDVPRSLVNVVSQITRVANSAKYGLFLFPTTEAGSNWQSVGNLINDTASDQSKDAEQAVKDVVQMEDLFIASISEEKSFADELKALKASILERVDGAEPTTDTLLTRETKVEMETTYSKKQYFYKSLVWGVLGFIALCFMWLAGGTKVSQYLSWVVWFTSIMSFSYLMVGIVSRGLIMGRFPIGNLFETIPFITGCAAFVAIFIEILTRRKIFLSLVPIMCMSGLFLARLYEQTEATDNMDPLVAVLNSNFWLSTHVFTIVSGYGAGILTGIISFVYVLMRVLGLDEGDKKLRRFITRAAYGCLGFTLFLSLIGTVLGGIWANDSWGRFWGWDPKENGALMIVLWSLFILHARLGGYLKEWGIHMCNIFGIAIIVFSWWHVNILGVGLHSYGFADEAKRNIVMACYWIIAAILTLSGIYYIFEKQVRQLLDGGNTKIPKLPTPKENV